jgi:hypothetical protein
VATPQTLSHSYSRGRNTFDLGGSLKVRHGLVTAHRHVTATPCSFPCGTYESSRLLSGSKAGVDQPPSTPQLNADSGILDDPTKPCVVGLRGPMHLSFEHLTSLTFLHGTSKAGNGLDLDEIRSPSSAYPDANGDDAGRSSLFNSARSVRARKVCGHAKYPAKGPTVRGERCSGLPNRRRQNLRLKKLWIPGIPKGIPYELYRSKKSDPRQQCRINDTLDCIRCACSLGNHHNERELQCRTS